MNKLSKRVLSLLLALLMVLGTCDQALAAGLDNGRYTEDSVTFKAGKTVISVGGNDLIIRFMSLHTIVIAGYIIKIEFL